MYLACMAFTFAFSKQPQVRTMHDEPACVSISSRGQQEARLSQYTNLAHKAEQMFCMANYLLCSRQLVKLSHVHVHLWMRQLIKDNKQPKSLLLATQLLCVLISASTHTHLHNDIPVVKCFLCQLYPLLYVEVLTFTAGLLPDSNLCSIRDRFFNFCFPLCNNVSCSQSKAYHSLHAIQFVRDVAVICVPHTTQLVGA